MVVFTIFLVFLRFSENRHLEKSTFVLNAVRKIIFAEVKRNLNRIFEQCPSASISEIKELKKVKSNRDFQVVSAFPQ